MKNLVFVLLSVLFFSCSTEKKEISNKIVLKNPSSFVRISEPIVICQDKIDAILGNDVDEGIIYFETLSGKKIPFQKDDFLGEIEYSLSLDFKENETKEILVKMAKTKADFQNYTNIRLGKDSNFDGIFDDVTAEARDANHLPGSQPVLYQAEGISWENDKVGFRSYWDKRNGKDIWGKRTNKMVLDSIGLPNTTSYHELQPWGADILKVGNSLGAGALAMKKDGKLIRLGETKKSTFKILTQGPIRSILSLQYEGWNIEGENFEITEKISIWKGKYGYKSELILKGTNQKMVTGIVNINLKKDTLYTVLPNKKYTIIYTFDQQSEFKDNLGLALLLKSNELVKVSKAPNSGSGKSIDGNSLISHTYYAEMQSKNNQVSFYFYAGWEKTSNEFKTKNGFEKMLVNEANKINNPIIIE